MLHNGVMNVKMFVTDQRKVFRDDIRLLIWYRQAAVFSYEYRLARTNLR